MKECIHIVIQYYVFKTHPYYCLWLHVGHSFPFLESIPLGEYSVRGIYHLLIIYYSSKTHLLFNHLKTDGLFSFSFAITHSSA